MKLWVSPELLVIPVPLRVSVSVGLAVMVKALAIELNTMPLTCVLAEIETAVVLLASKVAVSAAALGDGVRRPVGRRIPIARTGIEFPRRTNGKGRRS
jgi:hypothetical protein